jgi:hypothetical protein
MSDLTIARERMCQPSAAACIEQAPLAVDLQARKLCRRFALAPALARTIASMAFATEARS